jgi:uncharacterized protein (TIGR03437 family)
MERPVFAITLILAVTGARAQSVVAGMSFSDHSLFADGRPANLTRLSFPRAVDIGPDGLVYIAGGGTVRRIGADGRLATVLSDNQMDIFLQFAIDRAGTMYYDTGIGVRKAAPGGQPVTLAGYGADTPFADGQTAMGRKALITGLALGPAGDVYFSDYYSLSVWRLDSAGTTHFVFGPGTQNNPPERLLFDPTGRLYITSPSGLTRLEADGSTTSIPLQIFPDALSFQPNGTLYIASAGKPQAFRVNPDNSLTAVAGSGNYGFSNGCGSGSNPGVGDALTARFASADSLKFDSWGNLLIVDGFNSIVRQVTPDGRISTLAGMPAGFSGDGGPASQAQFAGPRSIAFDAVGNLYIADTGNNRVRKVSADGMVHTVAGDGSPTADLDYACSTQNDSFLNSPQEIAVDAAGNLLIADAGKHRVVKVAPDGTFTRFAGTGSSGTAQAVIGTPASALTLDTPSAVGVDTAANVYIGDSALRTLKVAPDGTIADVIPAVRAQGFGRGPNGELYLVANWIGYQVTGNDHLVPIAGTGQASDISPNGPAPLDEPIVSNYPHRAGMAMDANLTLYSMNNSGTLDHIFPSGRVTTDLGADPLPGGGYFAPQVGGADLAASPAGAVHLVDDYDNVVWRYSLLTDVAGAAATPTLGTSPVRNAASHQIGTLDEILPTGGFSSAPYRFMESDVIAPLELIQITGESLGPLLGLEGTPGGDGALPTSLGGVQVSLGGTPLQLRSVQAGRVIAVTPSTLPANAQLEMTVQYSGGATGTTVHTAAATAPGLFLTQDPDGGTTVVVEDVVGAVVTQSHPAARGAVVALFGTGFGAVSNGQFSASTQVSVNGVPATVLFAGTVPGFAGLAQVNIIVPDTTTGPVDLTVGGVHRPQGGRLWIQ